MATEIITLDDLRDFKMEILDQIKDLLINRNPGMSKKYLKSSELMKMLKISPGTLQNLRINGTLPYTKIGGIIFYDTEKIQKVMDDNLIDNSM